MCYYNTENQTYSSDVCLYSCCEENKEGFCCKYFGPILGLSTAFAVMVTVVLITIICCKPHKSSEGTVISPSDVVIEPIESCSKLTECGNVSVVDPPLYSSGALPIAPPPYDSIQHDFPILDKPVDVKAM